MEDIKSGRKLLRDVIFKLVFESCLLDDNLKNIYSSYLEREDALKHSKELSFLKKYVEGISENQDEIVKIISENLENWDYKRIGNVEKALLIISTYELHFAKDVPIEIVANEAVELAKEYGDVKTYEFVNGVIAKIVKKQD